MIPVEVYTRASQIMQQTNQVTDQVNYIRENIASTWFPDTGDFPRCCPFLIAHHNIDDTFIITSRGKWRKEEGKTYSSLRNPIIRRDVKNAREVSLEIHRTSRHAHVRSLFSEDRFADFSRRNIRFSSNRRLSKMSFLKNIHLAWKVDKYSTFNRLR